ncbi:MAG: choice-of-anchor D domain-containing protein [Ignavibacteriaceae bacterium]|nr:choice-of-anchor D domain-containing protein [Ignavibacteriaceae bacterium]
MRKLALLFIIFFSANLFGQSYHTINIDGTNDFNTLNERMLTTSATQSYAYVTFDAQNLYIGYSGWTPNGPLTDDNRLIHIYIDTDPKQVPTQGSGTTDGDGSNYRWDPVLPFSANYHYIFRTVDNNERRRTFNGTGWQDAVFETQNWKGNGFWELRLKLSDLGNPKQVNVVGYIEENWSESNAHISSGFPTGLFSNTTSQGSINFNNTFLNLYLVPEIYPNAAFHLANYQWQIQMKASVNSLVDTAYAGMAKNATDGWDAGVDLPKTPPPPSNYIQVFFPHESWLSALGPNYKRDLRALKSLDSTTSSWDFTINTDKTNSDVTISLNNFDFVPSNYNIKIKDLTADSTHNVRTLGNYVFNTGANGTTRLLRLIVGVTLASQNLQPSFTSYNFGTLKTDKDSTVNLTITNTGDSVLTISDINITNGFFSFTGDTAKTLATNETHVLSVKFAPRAAGVFNGNIAILSNDPDSPTFNIPLSGTGQVLVPVIISSTNSLNFGSVKLTKDSTLTFKVYNQGDTALVVSNITSGNNVFSVTSATSFVVNVNDSASVSVKFTPAAVTNYSADLTIVNNSPNSPNYVIPMLGNGVALIADLTLSSYSLAFGDVTVISDSSLSVYVRNTGETILSVANIVSDNVAFTVIGSTSFNVAVGDSAQTTIKFAPSAASSYNGIVRFISNDTDTAQLTVSGTGIYAELTKTVTSGWNLFSVPLVPQDNSASAVIGDDIASFFLYGYNASGYYNASTVNAGFGYWLGLETSANIDVSGSSSADTTVLALNSGWNILASPFYKNYLKSAVWFKRNSVTVTPAAAADSAWIQNVYYAYDKSTASYSSSDTLKTWNGYWFSALKDSVDILFIKNSAVIESEKSGLLFAAADINNWAVNIKAVQSNSIDEMLFFGASINATDGFDAKYDYAKPPVSPAPSAIQSYFERNDWNSLFTKYSTDIKAKFESPAQGKMWSFKYTSKTAGQVSLSWQNILTQIPEAIRNTYSFTLTGDAVPTPVNMLSATAIAFEAQANAVYSFFINANVTGVEDNLLGELTFRLDQNYPNPFNPSTVIKYSVAENGPASIKIFDVLGNEVATLVSGYHNAGVYTVNFDATGLTSGVYFYKLTAGKQSSTKKLMLTK